MAFARSIDRIKANQQAKRVRDLERTQGQRLLARAGMDIQRQYAQDFYDVERNINRTAMGLDAGTVVGKTREAVDLAGRDADIAAGAFGRERRALGLGGPRESDLRQLGLARVLAQVDAGNRASDAARGRQEAAQQWGAQQWGADATGAVRTLAGIAQSEFDRLAQYKQAKAQRRANIVGTVTGLAGAAAGAFL